MNQRIKEGLQLGKIKSVAWYIKGDEKVERTMVRLEDVDGKVFQMVLHNWTSTKEWFYEDEVILNVVLSCHGLLPEGRWIGVTDDVDSIINMCRKRCPYTDVKFINEEQCRRNNWIVPEFIF